MNRKSAPILNDDSLAAMVRKGVITNSYRRSPYRISLASKPPRWSKRELTFVVVACAAAFALGALIGWRVLQ